VQRLGSLKVDDKLKSRGLLHRQVTGLCSPKDAINIRTSTLKRLIRVDTIRQQSASRDELPLRVHGREAVPDWGYFCDCQISEAAWVRQIGNSPYR
jgi:hypothetical protein